MNTTPNAGPIGALIRRTQYLLIASVILCGASGNAYCEALYAHIQQRLALMDEVAAYKWQHGLPIEDRAREARILRDVSTQALAHYVEEESGKHFFLEQIRAAKEIQTYWFEKWRGGDPPPKARDLATRLRPEITRIGSAIIDELGLIGTHNKAQFLAQTNNVVGLSQATQDRLYHALSAIRTYPDRLSQIRATGIIRIGTTGDYRPFSYRLSADGVLLGADIDLARDFAATLNARPVFVNTTWPTLMEDLSAGKFDLAMSGISIIPARQAQAFFSVPYHRGGKTPIARCDNRARFDSFDEIDQTSTRIVVNPGGTNEKFVDSNIKHAQKVLHHDNRTIFDEIIARRVDVMITDSIEVAVHTARNPALCATMPGENLNVQNKGVLLPREDGLKAQVDAWLAQRVADGSLAQTIEQHTSRNEN